MDIQRSGDMYECFIRYQSRMQKLFQAMQTVYGFDIVDGNRSPQVISRELRRKIARVLNPRPVHAKPPSARHES